MRVIFFLKVCRLLTTALLVSALFLNVECRRSHGPEISVYSSSQDGDRLMRKENPVFMTDKESALPVIAIDETTRFQEIDGFGASFNEAGMICLNSLDPETQDSVFKILAALHTDGSHKNCDINQNGHLVISQAANRISIMFFVGVWPKS